MVKAKMDMTTGPIFSKLLRFAIPVFFTNLLQVFYNVADTIVVGQFDGSVALAAVGSTGTLTNLITMLFAGIASGAGVVVAQHIGAGEHLKKYHAMQTAVIFSTFVGVALIVVGYVISEPLLLFMNCPEEVLGPATLYMRIFLAGSPVSLFYNFCACIMRAHGDTKRPMLILTLAGVINVLLNLLLVIVFRLSVMGVAIATVVSQMVTAVCAAVLLFHSRGDYRLRVGTMAFDWKEMGLTLKIGIPVGINSILFNVANMIIQRGVNGFGATAMAGNSAANGLDRITHLGITAFSLTAISFAGQNVGAKKYRRLDTILWQSCVAAAVVSVLFSLIFVVFHDQCLGLFIKEGAADRDQIILDGLAKLIVVGVGYLLLVPEDILSSMLKGMGKSTTPVILNVVCVTGVRLLWIYLIFERFKPADEFYAIMLLYAALPVSWGVSAVAQWIAYRHFRRREFSNKAEDEAERQQTQETLAASQDGLD